MVDSPSVKNIVITFSNGCLFEAYDWCFKSWRNYKQSILIMRTHFSYQCKTKKRNIEVNSLHLLGSIEKIKAREEGEYEDPILEEKYDIYERNLCCIFLVWL